LKKKSGAKIAGEFTSLMTKFVKRESQ